MNDSIFKLLVDPNHPMQHNLLLSKELTCLKAADHFLIFKLSAEQNVFNDTIITGPVLLCT